jgi:hypothetical protein
MHDLLEGIRLGTAFTCQASGAEADATLRGLTATTRRLAGS